MYAYYRRIKYQHFPSNPCLKLAEHMKSFRSRNPTAKQAKTVSKQMRRLQLANDAACSLLKGQTTS
eukprot:13513384-Ditylum_brightwellii.AAC.1